VDRDFSKIMTYADYFDDTDMFIVEKIGVGMVFCGSWNIKNVKPFENGIVLKVDKITMGCDIYRKFLMKLS